MDRKIRVGAVSYLNTKPLIYGFEQGMMKDKIDLFIDYPANIAKALLNDEIDIGLVPVAVLPEMKEYHIISNYCIGCDGEVASVCLFSEVPLQEIETVLLDYQSRTSVALAQVLMKECWKINPSMENTSGEISSKIKKTTAAVIIGDRALKQRNKSAYVYDLGLAWKEFTNLPFLFAAWVSNKKLEDNFINGFNVSNKFGIDNIKKVVAQNPFAFFDLDKYYTRHINYVLDEKKREALKLFLEKITLNKQL